MLIAALTYGYDLGSPDGWKIAELNHNGWPSTPWHNSEGDDFYNDITAALKAAGLDDDLEIVRYGDDNEGFILAASADVERGPVSRPFSMDNFSGPTTEMDATLAAALQALGITPTEHKRGYPTPTPAKPGWINSAYQS